MQEFETGCIKCGKPLIYSRTASIYRCAVCKQSFESNVACSDGHYICDQCHANKGFDSITQLALETSLKDPIVIATKMMNNVCVYMHGPEHHYLVAAALLAAYKNIGNDLELSFCLKQALLEAKKLPGGICGLWGSCGAGISAGIFMRIITKANPLSIHEWGLSNLMTSQALKRIAENGGPRCCKRDTYLAIISAVLFLKEYFEIEMESRSDISCEFFLKNRECKNHDCVFYPLKKNTINTIP